MPFLAIRLNRVSSVHALFPRFLPSNPLPLPLHDHEQQENTNPGGYVAIAHYDDVHARLLRRDEVQHIFSQEHTGAGGGGIPCVLQVYVPPAHGLRYVVSYAYEGTAMAARIEVTARHFAARYPPNPPPCAAASMAAATAIQATGVHGASKASDMGGRGGLRDWTVPPPAMPPFSGSAAAMAAMATDATVVPPAESEVEGRRVRVEMRKAVSSIVRFMERVHGLRAQVGAFEFVVAFDGSVRLIGISRVEWLTHVAPRAPPVGAGVHVARQPRSSAPAPAATADFAGGGGGGVGGEGEGKYPYNVGGGGGFGTFGEGEDASFFQGGATVTTTVEGRTVRTPYSPLYGTGRRFGMPWGVTPTSLPGLGETLGRALDDALDPLPGTSGGGVGGSSLRRASEASRGNGEEAGAVAVAKHNGGEETMGGEAVAAASSAAETAEAQANAAAASAAAAKLKEFNDAWGFDQLPLPVELPPKIRYAAAPDAPPREGRRWTANAVDPTAAATLEALADEHDSEGGPDGGTGGGGGARVGAEVGAQVGAQVGGNGAAHGQHPTWDDDDEDDDGGADRPNPASTVFLSASSRPATAATTTTTTAMGAATGAATGATIVGATTGTGRRRPVVAAGPRPSLPRLTVAKRGGGAALAAARAADFAAPVLEEVEALREGLAAANFDRDNLANGLRLEAEKHYAEAGGLWLQNVELSKSLEETVLRVSQLEAEAREYQRRHAAEEKARGDIEAKLKDAEEQLAVERVRNVTTTAEAVARADDLAGQLETAHAELAMLTSRSEVQEEAAMAEEKFIGALRKENEELRKRLQSLMSDKGVKPMPLDLIADAMKLKEEKTEKEELGAGKPPPPRVPAAKLRLNVRDITRVESLRYGIEEAGILEGLDRLMVKHYGELRDVWRFYVSVGRLKRGPDGEARMSMLQFARFAIDLGVVRKVEAQGRGVFSDTAGVAGTAGSAEMAETDSAMAKKSTNDAKAADTSLLSGGKTFAPNADNQLLAALAETNERSSAIAEVKSAANAGDDAAAADDDTSATLSSSATMTTRRPSHSLRRTRGKDGYIALADADRLYAVVTLRQVEAETKSVSSGGREEVAGRLPDDRMLDFEEFCQAVCRLAHLLRSGETTGHASRKELRESTSGSPFNTSPRELGPGLASTTTTTTTTAGAEGFGGGRFGAGKGHPPPYPPAPASAPHRPSTTGGGGRPHHIMLSGTLAVGPSGPYERSTAVAGQGPFPVGPAVGQSGFLRFLERFFSDVVLVKARRKDDLKALAAEEAARRRRVPIWERGFKGGRDGRDRL